MKRLVPIYGDFSWPPLYLRVQAHIQCAQACTDCESAGVPWTPYIPPNLPRDPVREYDRHLYLEMA